MCVRIRQWLCFSLHGCGRMRDCECLARVVVVNNQEASGREMRRKRVGEKSSCATQILLLLIINNPTRDAACSLEVGWSQGLSREKRSKLRPFLRLAFEPEDEERYGITTSPPPRPASSCRPARHGKHRASTWTSTKDYLRQFKSSQAKPSQSQVKSSQVNSRRRHAARTSPST